MSFKFRFAFLLDLRCRQRDEAGAAVGQATEAIMKVDSEIKEINDQRQAFKKQQAAMSVGSVSVDRMLTAGRYDLQLLADEQGLLETKAKLNQELERRQAFLRVAQAEVKRFEQLKERAKEDHRVENLRLEQIEADDRNSSAYLMQQLAEKKQSELQA